MKSTLMAVSAASTLLLTSVSGAEPAKTLTGVITDTMCGSKPHINMMKEKTEAECVRLCVRGPYVYALFDGTTVLRLSDQKTAAKYAGKQVKVSGVYDARSRTFKVASMEQANIE